MLARKKNQTNQGCSEEVFPKYYRIGNYIKYCNKQDLLSHLMKRFLLQIFSRMRRVQL